MHDLISELIQGFWNNSPIVKKTIFDFVAVGIDYH